MNEKALKDFCKLRGIKIDDDALVTWALKKKEVEIYVDGRIHIEI